MKQYEDLYINIIDRFLTKSVSALEFEKKFLDLWHANADFLREDIYDSIESLFYSVDQFTHLPLTSDDNPEDYINENQLRESAEKILKELHSLK